MISRRSLLTGVAAVLAAPPIVRASSIMPVKPWHEDMMFKCTERFLVGPYGTIDVCSWHGEHYSLGNTFRVAAGMPIVRGDFVVVRNDGYAYPITETDLREGQLDRHLGGMSNTDSKHVYRNIGGFEVIKSVKLF